MTTDTTNDAVRPVTRRRVFYIPGYDPFGPRKYRELYRKEGAAQARISGYRLTLSAQPQAGAGYGWTVAAEVDGVEVETRIEVLGWSDIVKDSMSGPVTTRCLAFFRTAWIYLASGAFWRLIRLRKGPMIAAIYPVVVLLAYLAVSLGAGLAIALALGGAAWAWAVGLTAFCGALRLCVWVDRYAMAAYLMHLYAFVASEGGATPKALTQRLEDFRDKASAALTDEVDEVLIVGHSLGANLAVTLVAALAPAHQRLENGPALSLLTLGQVTPMVSFLPKAHALRRDLLALSLSDKVRWVDVSAPGDGCAFALCDPVAVTGLATPGKIGPLVVSAAFSQTLAPDRWRALKRRYHRLHFQYLCAFDRPERYDYFKLTAGPCTLAARFGDAAPSPSRIETPLSGYRTVAP